MASQNGIEERLARMETSLKHLVSAVDAAAASRDGQIDRMARVEEKIVHLEETMPQVARNAISNAKAAGWQDAKQDSEQDHRATIAILISVLALAATGVGLWLDSAL